MTHYDRDYSKIPYRDDADRKAISDIREYVTAKQWTAMLAYAERVAAGEEDIRQLDTALRIMVGISGYPLEAFYRAHCLDAMKEWYATDNGDGVVHLDPEGFRTGKVD
jgi:hypothetical protein